jgi:phage gpG-like protein
MVGKYIEVASGPVDQLLAQLVERVGDTEPFLRSLGEKMAERIKGRFETSQAPDGTPWRANSAATLARYIQSRGGKAPGAKRKGAAVPGKKPLIASGEMARGIHYQVGDDSLLVASPAPQAFMQHFGGTRAQFPHLWGDIPARPFFPIQPDGTLYPVEEEAIVDALRDYLGHG